MSQVIPETVRCAVCGARSEQLVLISSNTFGSPDLDLRPPEMERSTMCYWVQKCPRCGYVAENLEKIPKINAPFLKTEEYKKCLGLTFQSKLAKMFFQQYLIQVVEKDTEKAFYAALHAAWACDDAEDEENAVFCRKYALAELDKLLEKAENETLTVQRADLLRRAGLFDQVIEEYENKYFSNDTLNRVIFFQVDRSYAQDTACYTVEDALENNIQYPNLLDKTKGSLRSLSDFIKQKIKKDHEVETEDWDAVDE